MPTESASAQNLYAIVVKLCTYTIPANQYSKLDVSRFLNRTTKSKKKTKQNHVASMAYSFVKYARRVRAYADCRQIGLRQLKNLYCTLYIGQFYELGGV